MKTWVRKTLSVGVLAAGALLFAPGAANADVRQSNGDNNGILNGTQIAVPVRVPVNIVGNSLGILGIADSHAAGVNMTESGRGGQSNGNNNGILNGTQAYLPVSVPVNIAGNSAAVLGAAQSNAVAVNGVRGRKAESAHKTEGGWWPGSGQSNGDNNGILNGTQIYAPIDVPINVCGNSLAILGGASSQALCANNVAVRAPRHSKKESARTTEGLWQSNGDNNGILNGTQLLAPISLPVNLSGNAIGVLGVANTHAVSVNESAHGGPFGQSNGDNNGILNGTQIGVPINVPINVCGNSLGILGAANSNAACVNGAGFLGDDDDDWGFGGNGGHGHGGHGHGHGDNAGDNGDDDGSYLGDNGGEDPDANDDDNDGYGATKPATADNDGYGAAKPDTADNDGYGNGEEPVTAGSNSDSNGGRGKAKKAEGSPVAGITETVAGVSDSSGLGGLGLLNTLR
jgi:acetamidase/formamidase